MTIYQKEWARKLFISANLNNSYDIQNISDKNAINALEEMLSDDDRKLIGIKNIIHHLTSNSSVKRFNIFNKYFNFSSFKDEDKGLLIFSCLLMGRANLFERSLDFINQNIINNFEDIFNENFYMIDNYRRNNFAPNFNVLKNKLNEDDFKKIERTLMTLIILPQTTHSSNLFSTAVNINENSYFKDLLSKKIYQNFTQHMSLDTKINIDFSNKEFKDFYLNQGLLKSNTLFKNIIMHSKNDITEYVEFLRDQKVLDHLLKNELSTFYGFLEHKVTKSYFLKDDSLILKNMKNSIDNFFKPIFFVSEQNIIDILKSAIYLQDTINLSSVQFKKEIDSYYNFKIIDVLNSNLATKLIHEDKTDINDYLNIYKSLKEKETLNKELSLYNEEQPNKNIKKRI